MNAMELAFERLGRYLDPGALNHYEYMNRPLCLNKKGVKVAFRGSGTAVLISTGDCYVQTPLLRPDNLPDYIHWGVEGRVMSMMYTHYDKLDTWFGLEMGKAGVRFDNIMLNRSDSKIIRWYTESGKLVRKINPSSYGEIAKLLEIVYEKPITEIRYDSLLLWVSVMQEVLTGQVMLPNKKIGFEMEGVKKITSVRAINLIRNQCAEVLAPGGIKQFLEVCKQMRGEANERGCF